MGDRRAFLKGLLGGGAAAAAAAVAPKAVPEPKEAPHAGPTSPEIEYEIRRYVKSTGGFRKGLHPADKATAESLLALVGRKVPEWDHSIKVDYYVENSKQLDRAVSRQLRST